MTKYSLIALAILTLCFSNAHATVVWSADDFDGNTAGASLNPSAGMSITTVVDPTDGTNMVGQVNITGGGQWQSLLGGTTYQLPANTVAGTDTIDYSYRVYIPSTGVVQVGETGTTGNTITSIVRLASGGNNADQPDSYPPTDAHLINSAFPLDTWVTFTDGGTIPALNNTDSMATTGIEPILSTRIVQNITTPGTVTGLLMYIDDFSLSVSESVPEPSALGLIGIGFGVLLIARQRQA